MPLSIRFIAALICLAVCCDAQTSPATPPPGPGVQVKIGAENIVPAGSEPAAATVPPPAVKAPPPQALVPNPNAPLPNSKAAKGSRKAPAASAAAPDDATSKLYVIGALDVLEVRVWNDAKVSGVYNIRPDGILAIPLIGEVKADGMTIGDLSKVIQKKLGAFYMEDPDVNIQLLRNNSKKFFIFGEVHHQGEFPLTVDTTVLDALLNGGGFTEFANPKKIYLLRAGKKIAFNYKEVSEGKHMDQNIPLQNLDRIFVP